MNIFAIENDPIDCAMSMVDKHVVKMILETAQLLSTAHRVLDGIEVVGISNSGRKVKRWLLPDERQLKLYSATHVNHPSAVWARYSNNNYTWLYCHFCGLLSEYTYRYGKVHKCEAMKEWLQYPPHKIPVGYKTQVTPAMPEEYIVPGNSVASYRNYYRVAKERMHKWTKRPTPEWINV